MRFRYLPIIVSVTLSMVVFWLLRSCVYSPSGQAGSDFLALANNENAQAAGPVVLTDEQGKYSLGLHLDILEDAAGDFTIDQVASPEFADRFTASEVETPNFGLSNSVYWVRLPLANETQQTAEWLLEIGYVNMQLVDLYSPRPDGSGFDVRRTGSQRPVSSRDVRYPTIIFNLKFPPASKPVYYLRFQSEASMTLPLTLWTKDVFWNDAQLKLMMHWLFFGAILVLLVYHLFLMQSLHETSYLLFAILLTSLFAFFSAFEGYLGVYIFPQLYTIRSYYIIAFSLLLASLLLFSDSFLELKSRHPKIHQIHIGLAVSWGVMILLTPLVSYHFLSSLSAPWALVCMMICCAAGILSWVEGFRPARLFMFAWFGLLASISMLLLVRLGILPSTFITESTYQPGLIIMAVFWSFALADRINILKSKTEKAIQDLQKNERRLSQILDGVPLGIAVYGNDQKPEYVNKRALEILGSPGYAVRPGGNLRRTLTQAIDYFSFRIAGTNVRYPVEKLPIYNALKGRSTSIDDLEANLNEKTVPIEMWASPVADEAGKVESAVAAFQDITERKQAEAELEDHRKHLEKMVEKRTSELNAVNKELRLHLEWLEAVNLVNQTVASSTDFVQIYQKIVEITNIVFGSMYSFIGELDANGKQLKILAHTCCDEQHSKLIGSFTTLLEGIRPQAGFRQGDLVFLTQDQISLMDGPFGDHARNAELQNIIGVPLQVREQVLGFLGLEMQEEGRTISKEEYRLLNIFSTDIAQIIENANLFERTKLLLVTDERNRLARELHDSVTQALYSIGLYAHAIRMARQSNKQEIIDEHTEELIKLSREAMSDMRLLIFQLRPPILEEEGLMTALQTRLESVEGRAGFKTHLDSTGTYKFLPEQESELYWIAQEILNNVLKHAFAEKVKVRLIGEDTCFKMIIEDDGVGFDLETAEQAGGQGLRNIRERTKKINATCTILSIPGQGSTITLEMPLSKE